MLIKCLVLDEFRYRCECREDDIFEKILEHIANKYKVKIIRDKIKLICWTKIFTFYFRSSLFCKSGKKIALCKKNCLLFFSFQITFYL